MSTKNIAKTAIEGGRTSSYRNIIKEMKRKDRRFAKSLSRKMLFDNELIEDEVFVDSKYGDYDDIHKDKLSFIDGWFRSKIGKYWDDVYSEMKRRFDFRTIPGLHIVGHLMDNISLPSDKWPNRYGVEFFVDDEGIVQHRPREKKIKRYGGRRISLKDCFQWADGRKVRSLEGNLWWYGTKKNEYFWGHCRHYGKDLWGYPQRECPYETRTGLTAIGLTEIKCFQPIVPKRLQKLRKLTHKEQKFWDRIEKTKERFTFYPYNVGR